jgi:WD40 repeat protein
VIPTQPQGISATAFCPDGTELAVASYGGSLNVYRVGGGALAESFAGESGPILGLAWSGTAHPIGLFSAGLDSQLVSWNVGAGPRLITESGPDLHAPERAELFGDTALGMTPQDAPSADERGYAVDIRTGRVTSWPLGLPDNGYLNQLVGSHDGRIALVSKEDTASHNSVVVWDLGANRQVGRLHMPPDAPGTFAPGVNAAISPDGRLAYVNLGASRIGVFVVPSGRYMRSFTVKYAPPDAARVVAIPWQFAPDGKLVFGGADTGPHPTPLPGAIGPNDAVPPNQRLGLVDPRSGRLLAQAELGDINGPTALAWSPDRRLLAVGTFDGTLTLFDAQTLREVATAGIAEPGPIKTLSFAPSGHDLVSAGTAGVLNFWSVPDLSREASPVSMGNGANNGGMFAWYLPSGRIVGFAPDPQRAGTDLQRWFTFRAAPADLVGTACALAGRAMTRAEWQRYVADQPYHRVC